LTKKTYYPNISVLFSTSCLFFIVFLTPEKNHFAFDFFNFALIKKLIKMGNIVKCWMLTCCYLTLRIHDLMKSFPLSNFFSYGITIKQELAS